MSTQAADQVNPREEEYLQAWLDSDETSVRAVAEQVGISARYLGNIIVRGRCKYGSEHVPYLSPRSTQRGDIAPSEGDALILSEIGFIHSTHGRLPRPALAERLGVSTRLLERLRQRTAHLDGIPSW